LPLKQCAIALERGKVTGGRKQFWTLWLEVRGEGEGTFIQHPAASIEEKRKERYSGKGEEVSDKILARYFGGTRQGEEKSRQLLPRRGHYKGRSQKSSCQMLICLGFIAGGKRAGRRQYTPSKRGGERRGHRRKMAGNKSQSLRYDEVASVSPSRQNHVEEGVS